MTKIEHRSGAPAEKEEHDSSYNESSDDDDSSSMSSSSVSYDESGEGSSFSDEEESFTSSSASANGSDEESSYSSSSQHSRSRRDYSDENNSRSCLHDDRTDNDGAAKTINSPSSLMATTDSSNNEASPSSARVIATNRTFQRGVLPISISSNGHTGNTTGISNSVLTHRRGKKSLESDKSHPLENEKIQTDNDNDRDNHHRHRKRSSNRHRKRSKHNIEQQQQRQHGITKCCINYVCCQSKKRSSQILIAAFYLWLIAQFYYFFYYDLSNYLASNTKELYDEFFGPTDGGSTSGYITNDYFHDYSNKYTKKLTPEEMVRVRKQRRKEGREALGSAAIEENEEDDGFDKEGYLEDSGGRRKNKDRRSNRNRKKKSRDEEGFTKKERLKEGCSPLEWHSYHFPNCNEIHEIDLRAVVRNPRDSFIRQTIAEAAGASSDDSSTNASTSFPWGFVSNGLWRDVFSCDPRGEVTVSVESPVSPMPPAVLKIMKREHDYDQRNFQRHRRDALVMERLSSSHHLVPIYGYCANTVLTQAISHTLDDVIYARENERKKKWNPRNGYESKPPLESWMGKDENGELLATRETELGRIRLALGVFQGLMDLHEGDGTTDMEWLPVVHADLQAKQYLVDSDTGKVYLNDFNRCRFIGKKDRQTSDASNITLATNADVNATHIQGCPINIPTAPGYSRSPEEYNEAPLTEKLDIYSAGNILFGIITGKKPFNGERGKHIKEDIRSGKPPKVDASIRDAEGTVDAELARLLDRVYKADPEERASAKEIVVALEQLLEKVLAKREEGGDESTSD